VSRALVQAGRASRVMPLPRISGVLETAGQGIRGQLQSVNGAHGSSTVTLGSAVFCGVEDLPSSTLHQTFLCDAQGWLATFELDQDVRPDARGTVASLRAAGLSVCMLSGDDAPAVQEVGVQVDISELRAGFAPDAKLAYVGELQAQGHRVAMVGDGLNDGPVLAAADVSFAFGQAVPLAQSQCDFVILGDSLAQVGTTILLARRTMRIVRQNLWWALGYNLACVPLAVAGWLPAWLAGLGMASSSLVVVLNALRLSGPVQPRGLA
jgi:Cu2+-exporting ATPase